MGSLGVLGVLLQIRYCLQLYKGFQLLFKLYVSHDACSYCEILVFWFVLIPYIRCSHFAWCVIYFSVVRLTSWVYESICHYANTVVWWRGKRAGEEWSLYEKKPYRKCFLSPFMAVPKFSLQENSSRHLLLTWSDVLCFVKVKGNFVSPVRYREIRYLLVPGPVDFWFWERTVWFGGARGGREEVWVLGVFFGAIFFFS